MIEINLVPDVKQQALRAQSQRNAVISIAILVAIIAGIAVGVIAFYVFGVQTARTFFVDNAIKDGEKKLKEVKDLDKALTFQNQLSQISTIHSKSGVESRMFSFLLAAQPPADKAEIRVKKVEVNTAEKKITIEAESPQLFVGAETYSKTIQETKYVFSKEGSTSKETVTVTDKVEPGDRKYSEDENKQAVLRFTLSFTYNDALFSRDSKEGKFDGPVNKNVTDSTLSIPVSIFQGENK